MSLWQFAAAVDGYNAANGSKDKPDAPSDEEFEAYQRRKARADQR